MTATTWFFFAGFLAALIGFGVMSSAAIRLASRLTDTERSLRASRQAHAMDVQALTQKLMEARKEAQQ